MSMTLFGIGLGEAADSFKDAYKTFSDVERKKEEGARDERRVSIAERADQRAAASAARTAKAEEEARATARAEFGSTPATSALAPAAPEAPIGSPSALGGATTSPPVTAAPGSGLRFVPRDATPDTEEAVGGPTTGRTPVVEPPSAMLGGPKTRSSGDLSGTATSRTGSTGEDSAMERLRSMAAGGSVAAANRLREMTKAREDRADKDRAFGLKERELAETRKLNEARIRVLKAEGDDKDFELVRKKAEESARRAYSTIESELKGVDDATPLTDPVLVGRATRAIDELKSASRDMPDRRTMDVKKASDGTGFDVRYKSFTGSETTERVRTAGDLRRLGMIAGTVTNPKLYNEYLGVTARTDYVAALSRMEAEGSVEDAKKAAEARKIMTEFNAALKDKRRMMENPEEALAMARELMRLDPKNAEVRYKEETTTATGDKKTTERTVNRWEEMIKREMPAESVTIPDKKDPKKEGTTISWTDEVRSRAPKIAEDLKRGIPVERIREVNLMALRQNRWPPARAAYIVDEAIKAAGGITDKNDPATMTSPSPSAAVSPAPGVVPGSVSSAIDAARSPDTPRVDMRPYRIDPRTGTLSR